jgi:hypothetical protein
VVRSARFLAKDFSDVLTLDGEPYMERSVDKESADYVDALDAAGRCSLTLSKSVLKAPMVSVLETTSTMC